MYLPRSSPSIAITNPKSTLGLLEHISIFSLGPNTAEVPQFTNFQSLCLSSLSLPPFPQLAVNLHCQSSCFRGLGLSAGKIEGNIFSWDVSLDLLRERILESWVNPLRKTKAYRTVSLSWTKSQNPEKNWIRSIKSQECLTIVHSSPIIPKPLSLLVYNIL